MYRSIQLLAQFELGAACFMKWTFGNSLEIKFPLIMLKNVCMYTTSDFILDTKVFMVKVKCLLVQLWTRLCMTMGGYHSYSAEGIMVAQDCVLLIEHRVHRNQVVFQRMGYVKRKCSNAGKLSASFL